VDVFFLNHGVELNSGVPQPADWVCGLHIFWSTVRPCNDRACLYVMFVGIACHHAQWHLLS